jgi:hypothetical protein
MKSVRGMKTQSLTSRSSTSCEWADMATVLVELTELYNAILESSV